MDRPRLLIAGIGNIFLGDDAFGVEVARRLLQRRRERDRGAGGSSAALLITGLVVVGLGLLAWHYIGPDLKRYLKIHSM